VGIVLEIQEVRKAYRGGGEGPVVALDGVSLTVPQGAFTAVMGSSGAGKTTLLHVAGGLDLPDTGRVIVEGQDLTAMSDRKRTLFRRTRLGVVFQGFNLLPTLTARENVALPLLVGGLPHREIEARTERMMQLVQLDHRAAHRPEALSGGEQQRVAIARALLNDPALILADEPTGNLDSRNAESIWRLLRQLTQEEGRTVLMVTHEAAAARYCDRVLVLHDGRLVGEFAPGKEGDAASVAARYQELGG
jgi:putative ABC transport system ATP-binding protein